MDKAELYLKTIFCCMACDGDIAEEEIEMVKELSLKDNTFSSLDVEALINQWINELNEKGATFLGRFLNELSSEVLTPDEQMMVVDYALKTIEADHRIEYSEVKFFKKIRARLSISDEEILERYPDKEDFLLPDINPTAEFAWDDNTHFKNISL